MILVKAIKPGKPFQSSIYRAEVKQAAKEIEQGTLADFAKTVKTWKDKPEFESKVIAGSGQVSISVTTDDPVYAYVDLGTKKHRIRPKKKGGFLAFQRKYKAKTKPKVIGSTSGGSSGETVFSKGVMHPGTKARKFTQTIQAKWKPEFTKRMNAAMKAFAKRTGHGA